MTNKQISNYEFNARITNPDEPSDHELLMDLSKSVKSDHELLKQLVTKVNSIETNLSDFKTEMCNFKTEMSNFKTEITTRLDNLVKKNNLIE